jgi:hypothetical protein
MAVPGKIAGKSKINLFIPDEVLIAFREYVWQKHHSIHESGNELAEMMREGLQKRGAL